MNSQWNVARDFYEKKRDVSVSQAIIKQLQKSGFFVVSKEQAQRIKQKYIEIGMQMYHDRYMKGGIE